MKPTFLALIFSLPLLFGSGHSSELRADTESNEVFGGEPGWESLFSYDQYGDRHPAAHSVFGSVRTVVRTAPPTPETPRTTRSPVTKKRKPHRKKLHRHPKTRPGGVRGNSSKTGKKHGVQEEKESFEAAKSEQSETRETRHKTKSSRRHKPGRSKWTPVNGGGFRPPGRKNGKRKKPKTIELHDKKNGAPHDEDIFEAKQNSQIDRAWEDRVKAEHPQM